MPINPREAKRTLCIPYQNENVNPNRPLRLADETHPLRKLAKAALGQYSLQGARLEFLRGNRRQQLFRVTSLARGEFVLRMYRPPKSRQDMPFDSEEALSSQLLWLSALRQDMNLSVPEPIPALDGSFINRVSVEGVQQSRNCVLLSWMPGIHRTLGSPNPADLSLIGAYVARLHEHAERYSAPEGFARPRWDWEHLFDKSALLWSKGRDFY